MNFIKSLFANTPKQQTKKHVNKYLSNIEFNAKQQALTLSFQYQLNNSISQCKEPKNYIRQLLDRLSTSNNVSSIVKMFTIIHNAIYQRCYNKDDIECLEDIRSPILQNQQEKAWFNQFTIYYCNYLRKLPSVGDVYRRAKTPNSQQIQRPNYLMEVFRIINQMGMLFPWVCTLSNTIGRYYLKQYPEFPELYAIICVQVANIYDYLNIIIQKILASYRDLNAEQLRMFVKTIPQIELTSDKMEDLILNKYFKKKSIKSKIYLKEEKVQQIYYYLDYELAGKQIKDHQETFSLNSNEKQKIQN